MISAGQTIPKTTPKQRGAKTIDTLPKSIHKSQEKPAEFFCGGAWVDRSDKAIMGHFLRRNCVKKLYGIWKDYYDGTKGEKKGVTLKGSQFVNYRNIIIRATQGAYFDAVSALEKRASRLSIPATQTTPAKPYPAQITNPDQAKTIQNFNFANAQMYAVYKGKVKLSVPHPTTGKIVEVSLVDGLFDLARKLALKGVNADKVIFLPGTLRKEIKMIEGALPPGWRLNHNIERVVRLYLETKSELKQGKANTTKYNDDKVALEVVQGVRRIAFKAAYPHLPVPAASVKITDAVAKATYKKLDHLRGPGFDAKSKEFLWVMTNTFALKAKIKTTGTGSSAKHEVWINLYRAKEIRKRVNQKPNSKDKDDLSTLALTRTSKGQTLRKTMSFRTKIGQADTVRDQMVKALKRFYPKKAGIVLATNKTNYAANRAALKPVVGKMVAATIRGMRDTFRTHFDGENPTNITLNVLEARGVKLEKSGKDPHMVLFKLSVLKSTGGVPPWVIHTIAKGNNIRAAVAMRRYQQAMKKMGDDAKDPKKLMKMGKTLVKELKDKPTDKLLLSVVAKVKPDGEVVIKYLPKTLLRHIKSSRVKSAGAKVDLRHPSLGVVDIADQIKRLFGELEKIAGDELKGPDAGKKKEALLDALVDKLLKLVKDEDTFALKKKKGVSVIFNETTINVKDSDGNPILDAGGNVLTTSGYTAKITLEDKGVSGLFFPNLVTTKFDNGWTGTLTGNLYLGVNTMKGLGITHYESILLGYALRKGGFIFGFNVGAENLEGQAADRFSRLTEGGPIRNIPFSMNDPFAISRYKASAFLGYGGKVGQWKLSGKASGGLLNSRPGIPGSVSRELIDHNTVNGTLSGSRMLGMMATLNAAFDDGNHKASLTFGFKGGAMTSAALRSHENGDKANWTSGTHLTTWLTGTYSYKHWLTVKLGVGYDKQLEGKMMHPTLDGVPMTPAGTQLSAALDFTTTPLNRKKTGSVDFSIILNGGFAYVSQKYDRLQVPNEANETISYASAQLRVGTKAGDFSIFGALNHIRGSYTSYLLLDPRTNDVTRQIVDYSGPFGGGGICWSFQGLRTCVGVNRFRIQSTQAEQKKSYTSFNCTFAAPF